MVRLVETALRHATAALLDDDPLDGDFNDLLLALNEELDDQTTGIRALGGLRAAPADLCRIVVGVQVGMDAECLGELVRSVADIARSNARSRQATPSWPAAVDGIVREMSQDCLVMIATLAAAMEAPGPIPVRDMQRTRDDVDLSHALLHRELVALGDTVTVRTATDISLASRCLARCADHIVSVARHLTLVHDIAPDTTSTA